MVTINGIVLLIEGLMFVVFIFRLVNAKIIYPNTKKGWFNGICH